MVLRAHLALQAPAVQAALQVQMAVAEHQAPMEATGRVGLPGETDPMEQADHRAHQEQTVHLAQVAPMV